MTEVQHRPRLQRIIRDLLDAGARTVVMPRCGDCGRQVFHRHSFDGTRMCSRCYSKATAKPCSQCGRVAPVTAATPTGPVCAWCRANDPQLWERCGGCGHVRHITRRVDGVLPLCARCYERPKRECQGCGRSMLISSEKTGVPLCARCDRGGFRECGRCGRVRRITKRVGPNNPDICDGCYRRPLERCAACGQIRPRIGRTADGAHLCAACTTRPSRTCSLCGDHSPPAANWPAGPVCASCYVHRELPCRSCGTVTRPYVEGNCARCVLHERVDEVLGPSDDLDASLTLLRDALLASPRPRSVIGWLAKSPTTDVLRRIGAGDLPFTHETFDLHLPDRAGSFIRALCGAVGALPQRSLEMSRFDDWLDERLRDRPRQQAALVRAFATWTVRRRLQRLADSQRLTTSQTRNARQSVTVTLHLIDWLDQQGRDLEDLDQAILDEWLVAGSTARYHVRPFVVWCRVRGLTKRDLRVPHLETKRPMPPAPRDNRTALVRRLLVDEDLDLQVRVAGLLVLLYGQLVTRVALLTHDSIHQDTDGTSLRLGTTPVQLPEPVARLVVELRNRPPHGAAGVRGDHAWLFTGKLPGRPMVAHALQQALTRNGIPRVTEPQRQPHGPCRRHARSRARRSPRPQRRHRPAMGSSRPSRLEQLRGSARTSTAISPSPSSRDWHDDVVTRSQALTSSPGPPCATDSLAGTTAKPVTTTSP